MTRDDLFGNLKMPLDEFYTRADKSTYDNFIVLLELKYDHEEYYRKEQALYMKMDSEGNNWEWDYDWNEGETDVWVVGAYPTDAINVYGRFLF